MERRRIPVNVMRKVVMVACRVCWQCVRSSEIGQVLFMGKEFFENACKWELLDCLEVMLGGAWSQVRDARD